MNKMEYLELTDFTKIIRISEKYFWVNSNHDVDIEITNKVFIHKLKELFDEKIVTGSQTQPIPHYLTYIIALTLFNILEKSEVFDNDTKGS